MNMLAMTPQNSSGLRVITEGPGWTPFMISAPRISAMVALPGMPSVSVGMKAVWAAALLAASGAATPSIAPWPKRDGSFASFFSSI